MRRRSRLCRRSLAAGLTGKVIQGVTHLLADGELVMQRGVHARHLCGAADLRANNPGIEAGQADGIYGDLRAGDQVGGIALAR